VQGLVSGLRRKMGGALITRNPGYVLTEISSDLARCEQLIRQAQRASDAAEKADLLRDAGKLWRGEPLDGVSAPGTAASRVRLAELRTSLAEEHFDAEFALGRHAEVVRELFALVAVHPLRERLTGQLMLALYHSNRRAEALAAYANLRNRLAEELGTDPCPDLRDLQRSILRGDTLALSAPETIAIGAVSPRQEARAGPDTGQRRPFPWSRRRAGHLDRGTARPR
jgi:DNA-binding SARP family transcriptional activator